MSIATLPSRVRGRALREARCGFVRWGQIPRYAYRHYFIEAEGLHSRIHLQNFYSVMWPHLLRPVDVRVEAFDSSGDSLGSRRYNLEPFGSLFLDVADLLADLRVACEEGTVLVDVPPPRDVAKELSSLIVTEQWDLNMGTPFWMAYRDADENYMYVHSISPEMSRFYGVPGVLGRLFTQGSEAPGIDWRAGRLIDGAGLTELQIVLVNHAASARTPQLGLFDARDHKAVWSERMSLGPHAVRRVPVPAAAIADFVGRDPAGRFRVGIDPLPTSNGKPYLLMRYGDGPLSLHHG